MAIDLEFPQLISESEITEARKQADKRIHGFTDSEIKELRIKAKWDLGWLAHGVLGYNKLSPNLHGEICLWIRETRYDQYTLLLIPRSHYKSTLDTISDSLQTALPDDLNTIQYPYNLGTNVRLCIVHDVEGMAQKFLRSITQHFTKNPLLMGLFPECVPDPKKHKINIKELELPRTSYWNESTFDTMGVSGRGQGNHYNILKLDDIYGEAARDSKTERESRIQWFDNCQSFLITPATDFIRIRGTRWAFDDVYAHAMDTYGTNLKTFIRSVWERDEKGKFKKDEKGREIPIFPEQFTWESLKILEKNKKVWNAQYINDPKEGSSKFKEEWKRYYTQRGRTLIVETIRTPFSDPVIEEISIEELDICVIVDPALTETGDDTGLVVTGMDRYERVFILEAYAEAIRPEAFCNKIFSLIYKWNPRQLVVEEVGFSVLYENWFRAEMTLRNKRFKIEMVKTQQKEKAERVTALAPWFDSGLIYFKKMSHTEALAEPGKYMIKLEQEYDQFGASDDYHILDALAMGPRIGKSGSRVWRKGGTRNPFNDPNKPKVSKDKRDPLTGYSRTR